MCNTWLDSQALTDNYTSVGFTGATSNRPD